MANKCTAANTYNILPINPLATATCSGIRAKQHLTHLAAAIKRLKLIFPGLSVIDAWVFFLAHKLMLILLHLNIFHDFHQNILKDRNINGILVA